MDKQEFEANWQQIKGKIKERWSKFTDQDIETLSGKFDQFMGMIEEKYHYTKQKAIKEMKNWHLKMGKKIPFQGHKHHKKEHSHHKKRKAG